MRLLPLLLAGITLAGCSGAATQPAHITIPDTSPAPSPVTEASVSVGEPSQILIDRVGINAPLAPTGLERDGTLAVPDLNHVGQAVWLCAQHTIDAGKPVCKIGLPPGEVGPAVIAAHVDGSGGKQEGAFFHLRDVHNGDDVVIRRTDGSLLHFTVYRVQQVHKRDFTADVTKQVYGDRTRPEIVLLTCTGAFEGGQIGYSDQLIIYAALASR